MSEIKKEENWKSIKFALWQKKEEICLSQGSVNANQKTRYENLNAKPNMRGMFNPRYSWWQSRLLIKHMASIYIYILKFSKYCTVLPVFYLFTACSSTWNLHVWHRFIPYILHTCQQLHTVAPGKFHFLTNKYDSKHMTNKNKHDIK